MHGLSCRLKDDTAALVQGREKLQKKLEKHTIYHKYLDRVLESAEEFHEIREIIARYDTLTATHLVGHCWVLPYILYRDTDDHITMRITIYCGCFSYNIRWLNMLCYIVF